MKKYLVFIICTVVCISCNTQEERLTESVHRSVYWLWKQQSEDGGWHSSTHTILADGKVLTPYILFHLMQVSNEIFPADKEAVQRGVAFVQKEIRSSMTMGPDSLSILNYPNYSAAYALRVLIQAGIDTSLQRVIATHLLQEQFVEHRGITPDHLAYGGWGYGEPGIPYGEHGHVDISHTRRIVEALMLYEGQNGSPSHMHSPENKGQIFPYASATKGRTVERKNGRTAEGQNGGRAVRQNGGLMNVNELSHGLLTRSRLTADGSRLQSQVSIFLAGTQRTTDDPRPYEGCLSRKTLPYDGGFISSLVTLSTNKGEPIFIEGAGLHYPSYATATCDGLMALHALGLKETKAYHDAKSWLEKNQDMDTVDGLQSENGEPWDRIMKYYHWAVRAEAMTTAGIEGKWSKRLAHLLIKEQLRDGYYINPMGGINKEDDPLLATTFAVQAGSLILKYFSAPAPCVPPLVPGHK